MSPVLPAGFGLGGHLASCLTGAGVLTEPLSEPLQKANESHDHRMLQALIASMQGAGITNPNPAVGCLIFQGNQLLATGATEAYGGRHAERVAFNLLEQKSLPRSNLEVYVTLEPCSHHGRQPPCCELFNASGISRVHVATQDPNPLVSGRGLNYISQLGIPVHVMQGKAVQAITAWHLPFLVAHALGRPFIAGKWAQTLDGALADASGQSKWITGSEARAYGHWLRLKYDITAVGLTTFLEDQPSLTVRDCWRPSERQPSICIMDLLGECDPKSTAFMASWSKLKEASSDRKVALVCPRSHASQIESRGPAGLTILPYDPLPQNKSPLADAMTELWSSTEFKSWFGRSPQSIFVEGGAQLLSAFLQADLLDVLHVFVAPKILGNMARRVSASIHTSPQLSMAAHFDILSTSQLGSDMLLELAPKRIVDRFFAQGQK
jgi:diaminohydroxyphosphoribosylaminopyrimidine deaminase/5-amino-6-(5-phosphoribosylamino)uracil reductase